ncbi:MAG: crossover junction endodeoxyribonuclease RuvC [Desulfotomaculaceae bacterium]|nr:crossover junction endodeoxyribonuclease RuvC [Desulfotomaculaceae bacterium]
MLILGIDPGTAITGFGLVDFRGNRFSMVECGCIRTQAGLPLAERLQILYRGLFNIIRQNNPAHVAVEELFFNNNARTALAVGHARGVILLAAAEAGLPVFEYTPLQVKQAVVGYGRAAKAQVEYMVKTILCLPSVPGPDDVADALAVAICHAHLYDWERKYI